LEHTTRKPNGSDRLQAVRSARDSAQPLDGTTYLEHVMAGTDIGGQQVTGLSGTSRTTRLEQGIQSVGGGPSKMQYKSGVSSSSEHAFSKSLVDLIGTVEEHAAAINKAAWRSLSEKNQCLGSTAESTLRTRCPPDYDMDEDAISCASEEDKPLRWII